MAADRLSALYVCYFGLDEPLVQTQVLPYLKELRRGGVAIALLTFEHDLRRRWSAEAICTRRDLLAADGIDWHVARYHRRPSVPATGWDIFQGARVARAIVRAQGIQIVHGRSHVGALIATLVRRRSDVRVVFDVRGLLAEEYVENGRWKEGGILHRLTKAAERGLFRSADGIVVLTDAARQALFPAGAPRGQPIEVITCCVALERYAAAASTRDEVRAALGLAGRRVFVHAGTVGGAYLTAELASFLGVARELDRRTFVLLITKSSAAALAGWLGSAGFSAADYAVVAADPADVPKYLAAADVGLLLRRPSASRIAASPTKFAEYLAAGLPIVATAGVGDLDEHIEQHRVGVRLHGFDRDNYVGALRALAELERDPGRVGRANALLAQYDVRAVGAFRYRRLYDELLRGRPTQGR